MMNHNASRLGLIILGSIVVMRSNAMRDVASDQDDARVRSVIEAVGVFADFGEFEAICQLYDDVSSADYSSLWGNEPTSGSPSNRVTGWSGFIPGFDTTRHDIAVTSVNVMGLTATATATVIADHWLNDELWRITGRYDVVLVKKQKHWRISDWVFTLLDETGDRALVDAAEHIAADMIERPINCAN